MTDGLTIINTANLTAAVKNVFQNPLSDGLSDVSTSAKTVSSKPGKGKRKRQKRARRPGKKKGETSVPGPEDNEIEDAVISIPDQGPIVTDEQRTADIPNHPTCLPVYQSSQANLSVNNSPASSMVNQSCSQSSSAIQSSQPILSVKQTLPSSVPANHSSQLAMLANQSSSQLMMLANQSSQQQILANQSSQQQILANQSSQQQILANQSSQQTVLSNQSNQPVVSINQSSQPSISEIHSSMIMNHSDLQQPNYSTSDLNHPSMQLSMSSREQTGTGNQVEQLNSMMENSFENLSGISPLTIKQLLSCISPLTVIDNQQSYESQANNLKLLENLLAPQNESLVQNNPVTDPGEAVTNQFQTVQGHVEETDTPGQVQISASLLQNLLQGIGNPLGISRTASQPNASLPSFQQFASQPLQTLIQNLFPQDSVVPLVNSSQQQLQSSPESNLITSSAHSNGTPILSLNTPALYRAPTHGQQVPLLPSHSSHILQQLPILTPQAGAVSDNQIQMVQTLREHQNENDNQRIFNNIINASAQQQVSPATLQALFQGNAAKAAQIVIPNKPATSEGTNGDVGLQVQGLPLLLQPTGPGGPMQLIPLDKRVNTELLKDFLHKSNTPQTTAPSTAPPTVSSSHSAPIKIQPKLSNHTLENLLQVAQVRAELPQSLAAVTQNGTEPIDDGQTVTVELQAPPHITSIAHNQTELKSSPNLALNSLELPQSLNVNQEIPHPQNDSQIRTELEHIPTSSQIKAELHRTLTAAQHTPNAELHSTALTNQNRAGLQSRSTVNQIGPQLENLTNMVQHIESELQHHSAIHSARDEVQHMRMQEEVSPQRAFTDNRILQPTLNNQAPHSTFEAMRHQPANDVAATTGEVTENGIENEKVLVIPPLLTFCVDCNKLMEGDCSVHNTEYDYMADSPFLSRARVTMPSCFTLQQTVTSDFEGLLGVWCKECLSERTRFGPMVGQRLKMSSEDFTEQIHGFQPFVVNKIDREVEILHMVDENRCNWTMFIRYAPSLLEQNCTVYRDEECFYIVTKTEIKEEELLMWFSAEMCLHLGISQNPGNHKFQQCTVCGLYFLIKRLLNAHVRSKHPEKYNYNFSCYVCNKKFKTKGKMNTHMAIHLYVKPYSCPFCEKQFTENSNLKMHLLIHTGEKKFTCGVCGKKFRQKSHLENHKVVHSGERKFSCPHCDKSFGRSSDLKVHTYSHTKEVIHRCEQCGKEFFKIQNLKKHYKVHTGERNYMCNKCFKGFQTKYHRDRHLKICKEKNGKESSYMSLEEVAKLDSTCDVVPLKKVSDDHEMM